MVPHQSHKLEIAGSNPAPAPDTGRVAERPNAPVLKTGGPKGSAGSTPAPSSTVDEGGFVARPWRVERPGFYWARCGECLNVGWLREAEALCEECHAAGVEPHPMKRWFTVRKEE